MVVVDSSATKQFLKSLAPTHRFLEMWWCRVRKSIKKSTDEAVSQSAEEQAVGASTLPLLIAADVLQISEVDVELTLEISFWVIGNQDKFKLEVGADVGKALFVGPNQRAKSLWAGRVTRVRSLLAGNVAIDLVLSLARDSMSPDPATLAETLELHAKDH